MALTIKRNGFGQVEPNHLSAQRTGQIYAQLPADSSIETIENGMFLYYDYANNKVAKTGDGEPMLVLNEVKLYDDLRETYKDFAMEKKNYLNGEMVPRLFKTNVGDIFTTNMLVKGEETTVTKGAELSPNADGILDTAADDAEMIWKVVKVYTLADGQDAVKVQRIK